MSSPKGWVQGYNTQAAVDENGVIVSARLSASPTDVSQCQPMMRATREDLDAAGVRGAGSPAVRGQSVRVHPTPHRLERSARLANPYDRLRTTARRSTIATTQ